MRVLIINEVCGHGSTGKICVDLAEDYAAKGNEVRIAYGRDSYVPEHCRKFAVRIGNDWDVRMHAVRTRLLDEHGFGSVHATKKFLRWVDEYQPDLVWLHNLHGYYINIELLFGWIKLHPELEVKWTLHDCWAFTGHCAYFSDVECNKWRTHCEKCPQKKQYPKTLGVDNSYVNFERKKNSFTGVKSMTIITPSKWLAKLVSDSFLGEYPIEVQYNTINKDIFCPTENQVKQTLGITGKKMILGVASIWDRRKGLDDFICLSKMLNSDYVIVLVGLDEKQIKRLPQNIIGMKRTTDQIELAKFYSAADLFVNPSKEETFGLTTVEAMACGTDAIVLAGTACEEIVRDKGGIIVPPNDIEALYQAVVGYDYDKRHIIEEPQ